MGAAVLRERFLGLQDLRRATVRVPSWGEVCVRELTCVDREDIEERFAKPDEKAKDAAKRASTRGLRAFVACRCVIDPDTGERVFTDEDQAKLSAKADAVLAAILAKVFEISEYGEQALEEATGK